MSYQPGSNGFLLAPRVTAKSETIKKPPNSQDGYGQISPVDVVDDIIGRLLWSQSQDRAVAVDGKTLRGSSGADGKPVHLVSAFLQHEKIVVGQRQVDKKSNEITAFKPLLEPLDMEGGVVTADAMHTQVKHARFIVEDKKADYVFPVKQNQGNLFETIRNTKDEDFSPSIQNTGKGARTN